MYFISEVSGHHAIDCAREHYAKFGSESALRAGLRIQEGSQNGTMWCINGVL